MHLKDKRLVRVEETLLLLGKQKTVSKEGEIWSTSFETNLILEGDLVCLG